jgi:hypothetical protein
MTRSLPDVIERFAIQHHLYTQGYHIITALLGYFFLIVFHKLQNFLFYYTVNNIVNYRIYV